jgi:hypothetical protein
MEISIFIACSTICSKDNIFQRTNGMNKISTIMWMQKEIYNGGVDSLVEEDWLALLHFFFEFTGQRGEEGTDLQSKG